MSDIPDGADARVARMAIAWEMTKKIVGMSRPGSYDEGKKLWLATYNEVYEGLKETVAKAVAR